MNELDLSLYSKKCPAVSNARSCGFDRTECTLGSCFRLLTFNQIELHGFKPGGPQEIGKTMTVIETHQLCKFYGSSQVLHSIDMQIEQGRLVGFLGPNGAGKTTTIRILMGLLSGSSGSVRIFDKPVDKFGKQIRQEIGYLPGDVHLYSNMTAIALLKFLAAARYRNCLSEAMRLSEVFSLDLSKRVRSYSTGMRQKLGLIQALMHRPDLLILDEPTSSLDPLIRNAVFDELRAVTRQGRTVLFSSHSLDEVETLCDEVIILRDGQIVEHQSIDLLKKKALRKIQIVFATENADLTAAPVELTVSSFKRRVLIGTWSGNIGELLHWLRGFNIVDLIIERPDLGDLFIRYYTGPLRKD